MLILTRRPRESIVIGTDVVVTVLEVRGDQIRLGIDAPRSVQVHREEVFRQVEAHNTVTADAAARTRRVVARMPHNARQGPADAADPPSRDTAS